MIGVTVEGDRVVLLLLGRRRDVLVSCGEAEKLADALRRGANTAENAKPTLVRGERWEACVESCDGVVGVRFLSPEPGYPQRIPLPPQVARALANRIRFKAQQAAYRMRFVFKGVQYGV